MWLANESALLLMFPLGATGCLKSLIASISTYVFFFVLFCFKRTNPPVSSCEPDMLPLPAPEYDRDTATLRTDGRKQGDYDDNCSGEKKRKKKNTHTHRGCCKTPGCVLVGGGRRVHFVPGTTSTSAPTWLTNRFNGSSSSTPTVQTSA